MSTAVAASDAVIRDVIDHGKVSGQVILIIGLCLLFNIIDGFDITAMAIVASSVGNELGLSADHLGLIFSFALAGMMAGAMLLAPISDHIGRRKLIIFSLALVGVSIIATANATTLTEFIVLRFVSGIGAGALLACQSALVAEYSPDRYRAFTVLVVLSGYPMGAMMTSVIASYIMPDYGWRGMFWFGGIITASLVIVAWLLIPESLKYLFEKRPQGALAAINKTLVKLGGEPLTVLPERDNAVQDKPATVAGGVRQLLDREYRKTTLALWSAFLLCFSTLYFLMSWIPKLTEDAGFGIEAGRQAFFLFNLGGVIAAYLMGWLSTRWRLTNLIFYMSMAAALAMIIFALAPKRLDLLLAMTFLVGILQQGGFVGLYGVVAKAYPTHIRSTGIGWSIGLGRLGAVMGPAIAGYLIAAGFDMSANYIIFAVPMALGGFIAYRLRID